MDYWGLLSVWLDLLSLLKREIKKIKCDSYYLELYQIPINEIITKNKPTTIVINLSFIVIVAPVLLREKYLLQELHCSNKVKTLLPY